MKVLVTGATGFVGRWLIEELGRAGHEPIPTPSHWLLDITDPAAVSQFVHEMRPDAVAHLAGMAYAGDARREPESAMRINEGGTRALLESLGDRPGLPVLVAGSSEVYGKPDPADLPLNEGAPLHASEPYGRSKLAQEQAALDVSRQLALRAVVTRSFNMTGPGQREDFVAPALTRRVLEARKAGVARIRVGNLDVRRDIGDVRDSVRAYRLLLEGLAAHRVEPGMAVNVCTGRSTSIRQVVALIADAVGVVVEPRVDPSLVRANEAPDIVGDPSLLRKLTGWRPTIPLNRTLRDLVESMRS